MLENDQLLFAFNFSRIIGHPTIEATKTVGLERSVPLLRPLTCRLGSWERTHSHILFHVVAQKYLLVLVLVLVVCGLEAEASNVHPWPKMRPDGSCRS